MDQERRDSIVVMQKAHNVDWIFGLLTIAFGLALARGFPSAETTTGRVVIGVVFGGLFAVSLFAWVWFRRHPASLEISGDLIEFRHRGQLDSTRLPATGDLYVDSSLAPGGKQRFYFLRATGSEERIPLQLFDHEEVFRACEATGWRLTERNG